MREITPTSKRPKGITFVQWDKSTIKPHRELIQKCPTAAVVLDLFLEHIDRSNTVVVSKKVIAELTGYSRPTVNKSIKMLETDKWLQVLKIGSASAFKINHIAFWQGNVASKAYSNFEANVIIGSSEQTPETLALTADELKTVPVVHEDELLIERDDDIGQQLLNKENSHD